MERAEVLAIAQQDPAFQETSAKIEQVLAARGVTPDALDQIAHTIEYVLDNPSEYDKVRSMAIAQGFISEEDAPPEFDEQFLTSILLAIYDIESRSEQSSQEPQAFCSGGLARYSEGGDVTSGPLMALAQGAGTGRSDEIDAKLSDGEYVIDAETVALLGDGSTQAGARKLDQMREEIRRHKGQALAQGNFTPDARSPLSYLKEAA